MRLLRNNSLKSNMRLASYALLCCTIIVETIAIPIIGGSARQFSVKRDLKPVTSSKLATKSPFTAKLIPKQQLDNHHVLLKELFKTARNLYSDQEPTLAGNSLVLDLNMKALEDLLLDINPAISKLGLNDINKGLQVVSLLSDAMCKACKEKGDLECIKRHCLLVEHGPNGNDKLPDASIIPVLADTLCAACQAKNDPECIKIHCLKEDTGVMMKSDLTVNLSGPLEMV